MPSKILSVSPLISSILHGDNQTESQCDTADRKIGSLCTRGTRALSTWGWDPVVHYVFRILNHTEGGFYNNSEIIMHVHGRRCMHSFGELSQAREAGMRMGDGDIIPEFVIIVLIVLIPFPKSNRFRSASKKVVMTKVCTFQGTHTHCIVEQSNSNTVRRRRRCTHTTTRSKQCIKYCVTDRWQLSTADIEESGLDRPFRFSAMLRVSHIRIRTATTVVMIMRPYWRRDALNTLRSLMLAAFTESVEKW